MVAESSGSMASTQRWRIRSMEISRVECIRGDGKIEEIVVEDERRGEEDRDLFSSIKDAWIEKKVEWWEVLLLHDGRKKSE